MPRKPAVEGALFVRLPAAAVEKLDRAAEALGMHKKDLVAGLVSKYVDPDSRGGLSALGALATHDDLDLGGSGPARGSYSFQPYDPPEVMNAEQAGAVPADRRGERHRARRGGQAPRPKLGHGLAVLAGGAGGVAVGAGDAMTRYPGDIRALAGAHGRRADPPRRARLGPVLAPAQGSHRLPGQRIDETSRTSSSPSCCSSTPRTPTRTS